MEKILNLKSTQDGLIIEVKKEAEFAEVSECLSGLIENNKVFFGSSDKPIIFCGRDYSNSEKNEIKRLVIWQSGIKEVRFAPLDYGKRDVLLFGNVKSGRILRSVGDIVVIGDVEKGAELIASGNIIVLGNLSGGVFAGADFTGGRNNPESRNAFIAARRLMPDKIRIADRTGSLSPDRIMDSAEAVLIEEGRLVIRKTHLESA